MTLTLECKEFDEALLLTSPSSFVRLFPDREDPRGIWRVLSPLAIATGNRPGFRPEPTVILCYVIHMNRQRRARSKGIVSSSFESPRESVRA